MPDPQQLAVEALENAGWDADKARQIVAELAGSGVLPTGEEWGVRYMNLIDQPVYTSRGSLDNARMAMGRGDVLVHRYVSEWAEVPGDE